MSVNQRRCEAVWINGIYVILCQTHCSDIT